MPPLRPSFFRLLVLTIALGAIDGFLMRLLPCAAAGNDAAAPLDLGRQMWTAAAAHSFCSLEMVADIPVGMYGCPFEMILLHFVLLCLKVRSVSAEDCEEE